MIRAILSAAGTGRQTAAALAAIGLMTAQSIAPRYSAEILACAAFQEEVKTEIHSTSGTVVRDERAERSGVLIVSAVAGDSGIALMAWYDSLALWREGPEGRSTPDTDGLLGGRWRGRLSAVGRYSGLAVPFLPDDLAEVSDLSGLLGDFFPVLPVTPLNAGAAEPTADGRAIRRLTDAVTPSGAAARYGWSVKLHADTTGSVADTLVVPMRREGEEQGTLVWNARRGPLRWERIISITGTIPPDGKMRRGLTSTVRQRIAVTRLPDPASCGTPP